VRYDCGIRNGGDSAAEAIRQNRISNRSIVRKTFTVAVRQARSHDTIYTRNVTWSTDQSPAADANYIWNVLPTRELIAPLAARLHIRPPSNTVYVTFSSVSALRSFPMLLAPAFGCARLSPERARACKSVRGDPPPEGESETYRCCWR